MRNGTLYFAFHEFGIHHYWSIFGLLGDPHQLHHDVAVVGFLTVGRFLGSPRPR